MSAFKVGRLAHSTLQHNSGVLSIRPSSALRASYYFGLSQSASRQAHHVGSRNFSSGHQHASASSTANSFQTPPVESFSDPPATNAWDQPLDTFGTTVTSTPEPHLGYLKELGFDFGWGPTSVVQWAMEHIQIGLDLPIWGAAIGVTLAVRFLVLPLAVDASDMAARSKAMAPRTAPIRLKMMQAMATKDIVSQNAARAELSAVNKAAGIRMSAMFMPILIQGPLGFGLFRLTRAMSELPLPGLEAAGFGWISNLALPDPLFILPAITAGMMYITMKRGQADMDMTAPGAGFAKKMPVFLPAMTLAIGSFLPAITQVGFLSASIFQAIQVEGFRTPAIRRWLNMHPMPGPATSSDAAQASYKGTIRTDSAVKAEAAPKQETSTIDRITKAPGEAVKSIKTWSSGVVDKAKAVQGKKDGRLTDSELKSARSYEETRKSDEAAAASRRRERERRKRLGRLQ